MSMEPIRVNSSSSTESECVQEMVKKDPSFIPPKYFRSEEEIRAKDVLDDMSLPLYSSQIPILDLTLLSNGDKLELQKLDMACQDWGFFLVINHGIAGEVVESIKNGASGFFKLPLEEKRKYPYDPVTGQGYGMYYPIPEDQKSDWSDSIMFFLYPSHLRKLELWPATPSSFKDAVEAYAAGVKNVSERVLGSLSMIMGLEKEDALLGLHKEMLMSMRVNYYPACSKPDHVLGLSPHSDPSSITILLQDDHVTALQIRHDDGWVPVKPVPNSLVVNIGDLLEMWSNGKYKSIEHRAIVASQTKERITYASFIMPHADQEIQPLEEMLSTEKNGGKKYQKIKCGDYLEYALRQKIDGKKSIGKYKL